VEDECNLYVSTSTCRKACLALWKHELKVKYQILSLLSSPQIMRVVIGNEGVPYCVGEWSSNPVEHIEVDPVHG